MGLKGTDLNFLIVKLEPLVVTSRPREKILSKLQGSGTSQELEA